MENEDRFIAIESLLKLLNNPLVVVDVGARWGFQEHWKRVESLIKLIGVDADEQEVSSLNAAGQGDAYIPKVFGAQNAYGTLYLTKDPACSSLYPPDDNLIRQRPSLEVTNLVSTEKVEISTLDNWASEKEIPVIDFLKLDVQEAELDVLQGAGKVLQSVRMLEVEVEFNPIYQGAPLFGDVDKLLRQNGFILWRMKNFCHYGLPGMEIFPITSEIIKYDSNTVDFEGKQGQLYWADAYYVRHELAYDTSYPWEIALRDACMAGALGFDDLFASSLQKVLKTCPESIAGKIKDSFPSEDVILSMIDMGTSQQTDRPNKPVGVNNLRREIEQIKAELETVRTERDQAKQQVNALYQSRSYRITKPFRMATDMVRQLLRRE